VIIKFEPNDPADPRHFRPAVLFAFLNFGIVTDDAFLSSKIQNHKEMS